MKSLELCPPPAVWNEAARKVHYLMKCHYLPLNFTLSLRKCWQTIVIANAVILKLFVRHREGGGEHTFRHDDIREQSSIRFRELRDTLLSLISGNLVQRPLACYWTTGTSFTLKFINILFWGKPLSILCRLHSVETYLPLTLELWSRAFQARQVFYLLQDSYI